MAGEWIKFECSLPEKPETLAITAAMGWTDPDLTVGKLMRLFRWFDQQTVDGNAARVTPALLDQVIGVTGLTQAVASVGWMTVTSEGVSLSKFDRHNGESAKQRAQTAKRVAKHKGNAKANGAANADSVTSALPREEKRREEIPTSIEVGKEPRKRSAPTVDKPMATLEQMEEAGIPGDVAAEFVAHKASLKAPLTERAWRDHLSEASKAGWSPLQAAEKVMAKNWKGFEAKYVANEKPPATASRVQPMSFAQQDEQARRRRWEEMTGRQWPQDQPAPLAADIEDITPKRIAA